MIRICAWCREAGKPSVMGQIAPFDDNRETHGICETHLAELMAAATATVAKTKGARHHCEPTWADNKAYRWGYGSAMTYCLETKEGEFWGGNGEYESRINYCPFCGAKAPSPIPEGETRRER